MKTEQEFVYHSFELQKKKLDLFKIPTYEGRLFELVKYGMGEVNLDLVEFVKQKTSEQRQKDRSGAGGKVELPKDMDWDPSHDLAHLERGLKVADKIIDGIFAGDEAMKRKVHAIIILHDIITHPKNQKRYIHETEESASYAENLLRIVEFPEDEIPDILIAIKQMSFIRNLPPETAEGKISYDSDKADQSGAIVWLRYGASGGRMGRILHDKNDPFWENKKRKPLSYEVTLDALMKRVPEIQSSLFTAEARRIVERRNNFFYQAIEEFRLELKEEKAYVSFSWPKETGLALIMRLAEQTSAKGQQFYDPKDPLAEKRVLDTDKYLLDELIALQKKIKSKLGIYSGIPEEILHRRLQFTEGFMRELKREIDGE